MSASLDKERQKHLLSWLKKQIKWQRKTLSLSVITGAILALCIVAQAGLLALILQALIIDQQAFSDILPYFISLFMLFIFRALMTYIREQLNFKMGLALRQHIRQQLIDTIEKEGPASIAQHTSGGLSTLLVEQIEDLQDFYARYLPQMRLATLVPLFVFIAIIPFNWMAAIILLCTAPLIPLFMILVGMGAADVNRKNFKALTYLSGYFLDRLKGLDTIKLFKQGEAQSDAIYHAAEDFRTKTMNVLTMAFLSSAVLEFFTSLSIAVVAVYFGFSYLGELNFGYYSGSVTLFAGFFSLILAPEFFQPLRDLGTYYHAKAQAVAAADNIETFLAKEHKITQTQGIQTIQHIDSIVADNLVILSPDNQVIAGPFSFSLNTPFRLALMGVSGEGKTSLLNVLLGFLSYQGSLKINHIEFSDLDIEAFREHLSWVGQNPYLLNTTIRHNILLSNPTATDKMLNDVIEQVQLSALINQLPQGLDTSIGEDAVRLSVGQAQRIAIARALLKPCNLLLLDEPTASLDEQTALDIEAILASYDNDCNIMMITHKKNDLMQFNQVWHLHAQKIHVDIKD